VAADLQNRALRRLDALERAATPRDLNIPGFDFHPLSGKPQRYSVHVNGPWCITFANGAREMRGMLTWSNTIEAWK
jgi:proteic killer suppression protein